MRFVNTGLGKSKLTVVSMRNTVLVLFIHYCIVFEQLSPALAHPLQDLSLSGPVHVVSDGQYLGKWILPRLTWPHLFYLPVLLPHICFCFAFLTCWVYSLVASGRCILLCNHRHYPLLTLYPPELKFRVLLPAPGSHCSTFSLWIWSFKVLHVTGTKQYLLFCVWFISLSIMSPRFML